MFSTGWKRKNGEKPTTGSGIVWREGDGPSKEGIEDKERARGSSRATDWKKEIGKVSAVFRSAHAERRDVFPKPFEIAALAAAKPVFIWFFRQRLPYVRQSKLCPAHERPRKTRLSDGRRREHGGARLSPLAMRLLRNTRANQGPFVYKALLNQ